MTSFWPVGIDLADTASPRQILHAAQEEWAKESGGLLALVIQEAESGNGNDMLVVHAKHVPSNRTTTLFSVFHRPGVPYPARICSKDDELPDFLKRSYSRGGSREVLDIFGPVTIQNPGVCQTPSEFRSELAIVLNSASVKSEILSLVSGMASSTGVLSYSNEATAAGEAAGAAM